MMVLLGENVVMTRFSFDRVSNGRSCEVVTRSLVPQKLPEELLSPRKTKYLTLIDFHAAAAQIIELTEMRII